MEEFWNKYKNTIIIVGTIITTGVVLHITSQKGFESILNSHHVDVHLLPEVKEIASNS
jgi:hypothetical protein